VALSRHDDRFGDVCFRVLSGHSEVWRQCPLLTNYRHRFDNADPCVIERVVIIMLATEY